VDGVSAPPFVWERFSVLFSALSAIGHVIQKQCQRARGCRGLLRLTMLELTHFPLCFSLLTAFFLTRLLVVLAALQFTLDAIHLELFLQLPDGIFNVSSYFNFYHFLSDFFQ